MKRIAVCFAVDGHGANPQLFTGADHPQGYLAAIRDQYLLEHVLLSSRLRTKKKRAMRAPGTLEIR
jgi:hypothetical protein